MKQERCAFISKKSEVMEMESTPIGLRKFWDSPIQKYPPRSYERGISPRLLPGRFAFTRTHGESLPGGRAIPGRSRFSSRR